MRKLRAVILLLVISLPLAGCYYDPGSRYVRNGSGADAYYGEETTTTVSPGYYSSGYGYSDFGDFDGYGYGGCCFTGGLNTVWFGGDRRYYRDRYDHGPRRPPPGGWNGHDGGDRRPPPGGWHGGDGHGPGGDRPRPPGGWQGGGNRPRPPGGWQGGGDRPRPPGGWQGGDDRPHPPGGWQGGGPRPAGSAPRGDGDHQPASSGGSRPSAPRGDGGGSRGQTRRNSN